MDLRERTSTVSTRHPWETVRARFFCRMLAKEQAGPVDVLDIGAGDGFVAGQLLAVLPRGSSITCVDSEYTDTHLAAIGDDAHGALRFARTAPESTFDTIVMLDVLEHIADDHGFLRELVVPRLRPGGQLVISVPAHQGLFTQHDVALGHYRRYSQRELRDVLEEAGFVVRAAGGLFGSLLAPRAAAKVVERIRGIRSTPTTELAAQIQTGVSTWEHGRLVTGAIASALELDARLCGLAARMSAPSVGLSVWARCELAR